MSARRSTAALIALVAGVSACKASPQRADAARVQIVSTSTSSPWILARDGSAISTRDRTLWVFVEPAFDSDTRSLPGLAFGDQKGPRYGLLSGYFAPAIAAAASDGVYETKIELHAHGAIINFGPDLKITLAAPNQGRVEARVEGSAVLLPPADATQVRTSLDDKPMSDFRVTAGDDPKSTMLHADHLEVVNEREGLVRVATRCPRVTTPAKRGSTSVFAVSIGPNPNLTDPLFSSGTPEDRDAAPQKACTPSKTSTLTFIPHP